MFPIGHEVAEVIKLLDLVLIQSHEFKFQISNSPAFLLCSLSHCLLVYLSKMMLIERVAKVRDNVLCPYYNHFREYNSDRKQTMLPKKINSINTELYARTKWAEIPDGK